MTRGPIKKNTAAVAVYGDHEVIVPENKLRKAICRDQTWDEEDDPLARAEAALATLEVNFSGWMDSECERLDQARQVIVRGGFNQARRDALYLAAHDLKGQAATFGFPAVTGAADSLCRLMEYTEDATRIPLTLVNQHVDAVRAIHREYTRSDAQMLAGLLTQKLREVTDEFLLHENRARPDIVAQITAPPLAPDNPGSARIF